MLVLSRKKSEESIIQLDRQTLKRLLDADQDFEVSVMPIEIRGDKVRLGFECPKLITIHRREVSEAIKRKTRMGIIEDAAAVVRMAKKESRQLADDGHEINWREFLGLSLADHLKSIDIGKENCISVSGPCADPEFVAVAKKACQDINQDFHDKFPVHWSELSFSSVKVQPNESPNSNPGKDPNEQ